MAVELVPETFAPRVGDKFGATPSLGGAPLELVLSSCDESAHSRPGHPAFALIFHAPGPDYLEQQIFTLAHADLGEFTLFLVPHGPEPSGMAYGAVIN